METFPFLNPTLFKQFSESRSWEPGWLADYRRDCWQKFSNLPQRILKDEKWRFSPRARFGIDQISELANPKESLILKNTAPTHDTSFGLFDQLILDEPHALPSITNFAGPELGADDYSYLTGAFAQTGFILRAQKDIVENAPLVIEHYEPEAGQIAFHHNLIELEAHSQVTLIEKFIGNSEKPGGHLCNLLKVQLGEGARLNRVVIQECSLSATVIQLENFLIGKNAYLHSSNLHLGTGQSRIESKGVLQEPGAHFEYGSVFLGDHNQLFDQRTIQVHQAPHCTSNLLCKNALRKKSKSIFSGLIKVDEEAQHTDAYQTNRNLLLSTEAEADSLPGLEILANEVKCSHGATTSRIDPQELFYLHSRGIDKREAEKLIALGYLSESINKIDHKETRELALNSLSDSLSS